MATLNSIIECKRVQQEKTLLGYHGTTRKAADAILSEGFHYKHRNDHWLGQGVYFFQEDLDEAKRWAVYCIKADPKEDLCVIKSTIVVPYDNYLNLDTVSGRDLLIEYTEDIISQIKKEGIVIEEDLPKEMIQCLILDTIPEDQIKVITKSFAKKPSAYFDVPKIISNVFESRHTQICVRDLSCIKTKNCIEVKDGSKKKKTNRTNIG